MAEPTYTLKGDRHYEYLFAGQHIPHCNAWALDIGPGPRAKLAHAAIKRGWSVVGVDLGNVGYRHDRFVFVRGDFGNLDLGRTFDLVLNVSSTEHFGLPGRYGILVLDETADLLAMANVKTLMNPGAQMILTVPVGVDARLPPYHRVYGEQRLPELLDGYKIIHDAYYAKFGGKDAFQETSQDVALGVKPTLVPKHYYAIGCFVLEVA
jgi:hypothetical protein